MNIYQWKTNKWLDYIIGAPGFPGIGQIVKGNWKVMKIEKGETITMSMGMKLNPPMLVGKIWVKKMDKSFYVDDGGDCRKCGEHVPVLAFKQHLFEECPERQQIVLEDKEDDEMLKDMTKEQLISECVRRGQVTGRMWHKIAKVFGHEGVKQIMKEILPTRTQGLKQHTIDDVIEDIISEWNEQGKPKKPVYISLGWTPEQYAQYTENGTIPNAGCSAKGKTP